MTAAAPAGTWLGAILAGGRSRRMGHDKAAIELADGRPMIVRSIDALRIGVGVSRVVMVGGDPALATRVGVDHLLDLDPPIGPVGGVLVALGAAAAAGCDGVIVLPCDLPRLTPAELAAWWAGAAELEAPVVIATVEGRSQYPIGVWRTAVAPALQQAVSTGTRSFDEALARVGEAVHDAPSGFVDADTPGDLAAVRYPETLPHRRS